MTEDGRSIGEIVAPKADDIFEKSRRYFEERGIVIPVPYIAPDFDDPLPDSFWFGEDENDFKP